MSSRVGLRFVSQSSRQAAIRAPFRQQIRKAQTVAGTPTVEGAPAKESLLTRLWTSEIGVKTVHFWYVEQSKCVTGAEV